MGGIIARDGDEISFVDVDDLQTDDLVVGIEVDMHAGAFVVSSVSAAVLLNASVRLAKKPQRVLAFFLKTSVFDVSYRAK